MSSSQARSRKQTVWNTAKIVLALVLTGFVLSQTSVDELVTVARRISVEWLVLGFLAFCCATWFLTVRYWILIGRQISLPRLLGVVVLQTAVTNFVASGLGAASYVAMLRGEHQIRASRGITSLLSARAGDLLVLLLTLTIASFILWAQIDPLHEVVIVLMAGMTLGLTLFALIIPFRRKLVALVRHIHVGLEARRMAVVDRILSSLSALEDLNPHKICLHLLPFLAYSCLFLTFSSLWVYCMVRAFAVPLGVWPVVFVTSLTQLMSILPIQVFGGLGVYEVTSIYLYGLFGVGQSEAVALAIGVRVVLSILSLVLLLYLPAARWIERKLTAASR